MAKKYEPIKVDADPWNADWLRVMDWQLTTMSPVGREVPATTVPELLQVLGLEDKSSPEQCAGIEQFMSQPAFNPAPAALRRALGELGYDVPPRRIPLRHDDGANPRRQ